MVNTDLLHQQIPSNICYITNEPKQDKHWVHRSSWSLTTKQLVNHSQPGISIKTVTSTVANVCLITGCTSSTLSRRREFSIIMTCAKRAIYWPSVGFLTLGVWNCPRETLSPPGLLRWSAPARRSRSLWSSLCLPRSLCRSAARRRCRYGEVGTYWASERQTYKTTMTDSST